MGLTFFLGHCVWGRGSFIDIHVNYSPLGAVPCSCVHALDVFVLPVRLNLVYWAGWPTPGSILSLKFLPVSLLLLASWPRLAQASINWFNFVSISPLLTVLVPAPAVPPNLYNIKFLCAIGLNSLFQFGCVPPSFLSCFCKSYGLMIWSLHVI